jgi:hypothetical protein
LRWKGVFVGDMSLTWPDRRDRRRLLVVDGARAALPEERSDLVPEPGVVVSEAADVVVCSLKSALQGFERCPLAGGNGDGGN